MNKFFARLSPLERRFMVILIVVVFVVLNFIFVWPHFGDWTRVQQRLQRARSQQSMFEAEIAKKPAYETGIRTLEQDGATVPQENQDIDLVRNVQNQAALNHVQILSNTRQQNVRTNQFFVERVLIITALSGEKDMVDFVYNLGSANSMIRVRELAVRPNMTRFQLATTIKLVASYQKLSAPGAKTSDKTATPKAK